MPCLSSAYLPTLPLCSISGLLGTSHSPASTNGSFTATISTPGCAMAARSTRRPAGGMSGRNAGHKLTRAAGCAMADERLCSLNVERAGQLLCAPSKPTAVKLAWHQTGQKAAGAAPFSAGVLPGATMCDATHPQQLQQVPSPMRPKPAGQSGRVWSSGQHVAFKPPRAPGRGI